MFQKLIASPALVRVVPFGLFFALTFLKDSFGPEGRYWVYLAKTIVGAGLLLLAWRHITELEWRFSWEAVVVGAAAFVIWIGLDDVVARLGLGSFHRLKSSAPAWNPNATFGVGSALAWLFIVTRLA